MDFRLLTVGDAKIFRDHLDDPAIRHVALRVPMVPTTEWASERLARNADYGLFDEENNLVAAGTIFLNEETPDKAELGYAVDQHHRGKGYAHQILECLIKKTREIDPALKIEAGVAFDNPASIRVLEKAGFVKTDKQDMVKPVGRPEAIPHFKLKLES